MDTITLQRRDLIDLVNGVEQVSALVDSKDFRLVYALKRTRDSLRAEVDAINATQRPTEAFQAYEKERIALVESFALVENGQPKREIRQDGTEVFCMDESRAAEFRTALSALRARFREAIDAETERRRNLEGAFMTETVEVAVHRFAAEQLRAALLKDRQLSAQQMLWLWPLFSDQDKLAGEAQAA